MTTIFSLSPFTLQMTRVVDKNAFISHPQTEIRRTSAESSEHKARSQLFCSGLSFFPYLYFSLHSPLSLLSLLSFLLSPLIYFFVQVPVRELVVSIPTIRCMGLKCVELSGKNDPFVQLKFEKWINKTKALYFSLLSSSPSLFSSLFPPLPFFPPLTHILSLCLSHTNQRFLTRLARIANSTTKRSASLPPQWPCLRWSWSVRSLISMTGG